MRSLDAYQKQYSELPFEVVQAHFRRRKICEFLTVYRPRSLLEIGCGLDAIFNHFTEYEMCTVVEPGDNFVLNAREQAGSRAGIAIVHGTLEASIGELRDKRFDFIIVSSLLHELANPTPLLGAVASLCGPKTIVHVNVPNARSFHRVLAYEMGMIPSIYERSDVQRQMQQSHTFDIESLTDLVVRSGFRPIERGTFFVKPFTHVQMARLQAIGILTDPMLEGLYRMSRYLPEHGSEIYMNLKLRDS
jgi:ubiquinone/menaquinone biosynthesis C-methylase UbiE